MERIDAHAAPFVYQAAQAYHAGQPLPAGTRTKLVQWIMVFTGYLFGWRASTVEALQVKDVLFPAEDTIQFSESFCKGLQKISDIEYRTYQYTASNWPVLNLAMRLLSRLQHDADSRKMFNAGPRVPTLDASLQQVLADAGSPQATDASVTAHSLRVGACSAILSLNVSSARMCTWCGWKIKGAWPAYVRIIEPHPFAKKIYRQLTA